MQNIIKNNDKTIYISKCSCWGGDVHRAVNICSITATSSGGDLIATFTFDYPVASDYVALSIEGEGIDYEPSAVMITKGNRSETYNFPSYYGIPTKISITNIYPSEDSYYEYAAGEPWISGVSSKTNIEIIASIQGTTILRLYADQVVTSDLTFMTTLLASYSGEKSREFEVEGFMKRGSNSGGTQFSPPALAGEYPSIITIINITVSPTSDSSHTYTVQW